MECVIKRERKKEGEIELNCSTFIKKKQSRSLEERERDLAIFSAEYECIVL